MNDFLEKRLNFKRKILIVDDAEIGRYMLKDMLEDDYEIMLAENGKEALEIMRKNADILSIVLLDLIMPVMDGYEVLNEVGKDSSLSRIPVIVLTAEQNAEVKSLKMGAADFLPKPYDIPEAIKARIDRTIQLYESKSLISATSSDPLTGLFRREYFMNYIKIADQHMPDRKRDAIAADLNRFHIINELYGHDCGNYVLKEVGRIMSFLADKYKGVACRAGSNSFFLYISHQDMTEEILAETRQRISEKLGHLNVTVRMGVYSRADNMTDVRKRFDCALLACNSIKEGYSCSMAIYDKAMHEKEAYEERLLADMETGIAEKQFIVFYQPKYSVQGDKPVLASAEALIRWKHPEFGMVSPGVFIPLFERKGRIHALDRYVWKCAADQVAEWRREYGINLSVSVNVSRIDLMQEDFSEKIFKIVEEAGIKPEEYMLEVTESAYTEDSGKTVGMISRLREAGFRIEMDDFGSGYSSLNMISTMPIDVLKLDRGFVKNIEHNEKDYRMVEIIMEIARLLGVKVVAEGVETEGQHELLKKAGVDIIQGFYYSKPVPPEEFASFFI